MFGLLTLFLVLISNLIVINARTIPASNIDAFLRNLPASNRTLNVTQILEGFADLGDDPDGIQFAWPKAGVEPASDELWCKAVSKGTTLLNSMLLSDENAGKLYNPPRPNAQSLWDATMFMSWGWNPYDTGLHEYCQFDNTGYWGIDYFLEAIGASDKCREDGGNWDPIAILHGDPKQGIPLAEQTYTDPSGRKRKMSAGHFFGINGKDGGLIAYKRYGVETRAAKYNVPQSEWPPFRQSSDLMWSVWKLYVASQNGDLAHIKFFMSLAILNKETNQVLKRAFNQRKSDLKSDVMFTFDIKSEEGKAILGTPNILGFTYFLINHKKELGGKFIDAIVAIEADTVNQLPILMATVEGYDKPMEPADLMSSSVSSSSTAPARARAARATATGRAH